MVLLSEIVQTFILADFCYYYVKRLTMAGTSDDEAKRIAEQLKKSLENIENIDRLSPLPNVEDPLEEDDNPIFNNPDILAAMIVGGVVPSMTESPRPKPKSNILKFKEEISQSAVSSASKLGITFDNAHLEDLYIISQTDNGISEYAIWIYLKAVMRTNQISISTSLVKVASSLESILEKAVRQINLGKESNKLLQERMNSMTLKMDNLNSVLVNSVKLELSPFLSKLNSVLQPHSPSVREIGSSSSAPLILRHPPSNPGLSEVQAIFNYVGFKADVVELYAAKYAGKITWAAYNKVMTGGMTKRECLDFMRTWKKKYLS